MTRPQKIFCRLFFSFSPKNWMINSTHDAFRGVFEICGLIRKFWKTPVLACNKLSNRSGTQAGGKVFQKMRINPQILKTLAFLCKGSAHYIQIRKSANPEKWQRSEKNASPTAQKWILGPEIIFFSIQTCEPSVFCKKRHSIWSNMASRDPIMIYLFI